MSSSLPRPKNLSIYSQFTLQKAFKNYPKHFKAFHLQTESFPTSKILLKSLLRRAKSLKALSLEKYEQLPDLKPSKTLSLIKSFPHIQSLTLPGDTDKHLLIKIYIKWLKRSKRLLYITFGTIPISFQMHLLQSPFKSSTALLESLQLKYKKAFKRAKLRSLALQSPQDISSNLYLSYPSSLKKLSISSYFSITSSSIDLSHLPNLSILHLDFPIGFLHLLDTLHSLPNPQKLTHLTAHISDAFPRANKQTFRLPESLVYFQALHSLHLEIKSFLFISFLFKSFKNPENLRQLTLHIPVQNEEELLELALFIGKLQNLSHLALKNQRSLKDRAPEGHYELFNQISRLSQLQSLEISLYGEKSTMPSSGIFHGSLARFTNCVDKLGELQEITFTQSEICPEDELYSLAEVLEKKGSKLKSLRIGFVNRNSEIDHLEVFNETIQTMNNLEDLRLEGLWTQKESLEEFCNVISKLKCLRSVIIDVNETDVNQVEFTRIVREILMTYGLEELKWFGDAKIKVMGKAEPIDIKEVLQKNPRLQRIGLGSLIFDNQILSFLNKDMIAS